MHFLKSIAANKFILAASVSAFIVMTSFQNCAKTKFSQVLSSTALNNHSSINNPICSSASRPTDAENVACLSPNQSTIKGLQRYTVVCNANGSWSRTANGPVDYSLCALTCDVSKRPSDIENVFCPAPNSSTNLGVQRYVVSCAANGTWSRTVNGSADYSACPLVCNDGSKPSSTSAVACPAPNSSILSGIQNYSVTCNTNGTWSRVISGNPDFKNCPQSCDPNTKPKSSESALCPAGGMNAIQNYSVTCNNNGTWSRVPTTFDTSACVAPTCDPNTKPASSAAAFCSAPFETNKSAIQNYSVSCSGTTWVQAQTTRDESACPKACTSAKPSDGFSAVACPAPFAGDTSARQNFSYSCNTTNGSWIKNINPSIDYSSCPKACTGTAPVDRVQVPCPAGQVGRAYQNYSVQCNTSTGQYTSTPSFYDTSMCLTQTCDPAAKPSAFDNVSCPAPFTDRFDAKRLYTVSCVGVDWQRYPTGQVDTSSCPVNDCSGSPNPGPTKVVGQCPGGASGVVTQTCSLSCTGRTYNQVNCSPNDYSGCDCGPNATFNPVTQQCIAKVCSNGATNYPACNACGAGTVFNGSSCVSCGVSNTNETRGCGIANTIGSETWQITVNTCNNTRSEAKVASSCQCASGYTWNGSSCVFVPPPPPPPPPPPACDDSDSAQGKWCPGHCFNFAGGNPNVLCASGSSESVGCDPSTCGAKTNVGGSFCGAYYKIVRCN